MSNSAGNEATAEPTRAEFVSRMDAICKDFGESEEVQKAMDLAMQSENSAEAAGHFDRLVRASEETMDEVSALEVPTALRDDFDDYLDSEAEVGDLLGEMADAVREGNIEDFFKFAEETKAPSDRSARIAGRLGLKVCATD